MYSSVLIAPYNKYITIMQSRSFEAPIIIDCVTSCAINVNLHIPNLHIHVSIV